MYTEKERKKLKYIYDTVIDYQVKKMGGWVNKNDEALQVVIIPEPMADAILKKTEEVGAEYFWGVQDAWAWNKNTEIKVYLTDIYRHI